MSEDSDVVVGGRPPSLADVRPQVRLQQRTVKQIVDPVPVVPLLHDVEPQMVEQLVDFLAPLDVRVAELVIYVAMVLAEKVFSKQEIRRIIAEMQGRGGGARGGLPG